MNGKKILTFSNLNGNFEKFLEIFAKIKEKTGNYDLIILIGNVFNMSKDFSAVKDLEKLQTKILIFDSSEVGIVLKHKLFYTEYALNEYVTILGRCGIYNNDNIRIAYINGRENKKYLSEDVKHIYTSCYFSRDDIDKIISDVENSKLKIDIILTNSMPHIIYDELLNNSNSVLNSNSITLDKSKLKENVSTSLNLVMKKIKPRYIITSIGDFYFERLPYINSDKFLTRFINVSYFPTEAKSNPKEKFLFAINIKPVNAMMNSDLYEFASVSHSNDIFKDVPNDLASMFITKDKYAEKNIKISKDELYLGNISLNVTYDDVYDFLMRFGEIDFLNMIYDRKNKFLGYAFLKFKSISVNEELLKHSNEFSLKGRRLIISQKVEKIVTLESIEKRCWFCFNNPSIDTDLLLTEQKEFYVAYPKGPIDDFHFLIMPKNHVRSFLDLNQDQKNELERILKIIVNIINDNGLDYLMYEKCLPYKDEAAKHMNINVVGIHKERSFSFLDQLEATFSENRIKYQEYDAKTSISEMTKSKNANYYFMDAPTGIQFGRSGIRTKIFVEVDPIGNKDYLDYPRIITCNLIDKESRINWKQSDINKEFLVSLKDKMNKYFK